MAKENGTPTAAEKGKSKATDEKPADGQKKPEETKKDKDGKPIVNGTKGDEPQEGRCLYYGPAGLLLIDINFIRGAERGRSEPQE